MGASGRSKFTLLPFQGPEKSRLSGPTPSNGPGNGFALIKIFIPRQIHNGPLAVNTEELSVLLITAAQIHECRNLERGRAFSFLGIHGSEFQYSAEYTEEPNLDDMFCVRTYSGLN